MGLGVEMADKDRTGSDEMKFKQRIRARKKKKKKENNEAERKREMARNSERYVRKCTVKRYLIIKTKFSPLNKDVID